MAYENKNIGETEEYFTYDITLNINNICRICLEKSNKLTPIFDQVKPAHFSVLIMACASVQVEEGDGYPPFICQKCISRLNVAFHFKTQCEASDQKLKQWFENYALHCVNSYQEKNCEKAATEEGAINETHFNVNHIDSGQTVFGNSQDTSNINIIHIQDDKADEYKMDEANNAAVKLEDLVSTEATKKDKKPPKVHQCNTCGKIFRTKPGLVHHIRIHTGERPYVCHLCQKRFINGGHLHTHMKTHTGEKNHVCAACSKGFATAQQLTKHTIAIHTSERPYGCTYCPKRFASSSNLNTHIKIHTGEKNYHCEVCGKTFSTKGQLQQHMLIHTGEKAFLCEFCFKRFSQKAHLVRHLRIHSRTE